MNCNSKTLGLKNVDWVGGVRGGGGGGGIEDPQLIFLFSYIVCNVVFPAPPLLPCQIY